MLVVVKVGTDSVIGNMEKIAHDIISAKKSGIDVILVSSGAIGMGRKMHQDFGNNTVEKQVLASIGQAELISEYKRIFAKDGYSVGQILMTKNDIKNQNAKQNIQNVINIMLSKKNIIPIFNENDTVSFYEIMFTDNDQLAGIIAKLFNAQKLIIMTNVNGVYAHFNTPNEKIITRVTKGTKLDISETKSASGRGGMQSKVQTAKEMRNNNIQTTICNVHTENAIVRIANGEEIGTTFV
jgi:glutamate 5-kinase